MSALTRTKNRVFIVTPEKRPSEFIKRAVERSEKLSQRYAARRVENRPLPLECRERSLSDLQLSDATAME